MQGGLDVGRLGAGRVANEKTFEYGDDMSFSSKYLCDIKLVTEPLGPQFFGLVWFFMYRMRRGAGEAASGILTFWKT